MLKKIGQKTTEVMDTAKTIGQVAQGVGYLGKIAVTNLISAGAAAGTNAVNSTISGVNQKICTVAVTVADVTANLMETVIPPIAHDIIDIENSKKVYDVLGNRPSFIEQEIYSQPAKIKENFTLFNCQSVFAFREFFLSWAKDKNGPKLQIVDHLLSRPVFIKSSDDDFTEHMEVISYALEQFPDIDDIDLLISVLQAIIKLNCASIEKSWAQVVEIPVDRPKKHCGKVIFNGNPYSED